jgi:uncharacterized protein (TIGR03663 family)
MMTTTTVESRPTLLDRPVGHALRLTWETGLYVALILAAFVTRFYDLGARVMSHDESLHTQYGWYLAQGRGFQHTPLMHGVLRFEVTALSYWLFGDNDFTSRIPSAILGVAAVGLMYFYRRWLGRAGALVAAFLMLISPYMLYYSRYIRDEPYVIVWGLLMVLMVLRYIETRAVRYLYWLSAVTALFYATMEVSFIYIAITMLFLGFHLVHQLFSARWPRPELRQPFQIAFAITVAALLIVAGLMLYGRQTGAMGGTETAIPADPTAAAPTAASPVNLLVVAAAAVGVIGLAGAAYFVLTAFGRDVRRFAAFDLLMIFGLFNLPQLTAFPVLALGRDPLNYTLPSLQGLGLGARLAAFFGSDAGLTLSVAVLLVGITIVLGWLWDWRTFLISAAIFYGIFITLFTTFFTNGGGLASGMIGSLAYWLAQHPVQRGSQPWYYYLVINLPMYEFLPAIGAMLAGLIGLRRWLRMDERPAASDNGASGDGASDPAASARFPVLGFFGFWTIMALAAFSIAGEKMPWLTTHITLPLILLSGWSLGRYIDGTNWSQFRAGRAWLVAIVLPVLLLASAVVLGGLLGANRPFGGSEMAQLQATGAFISALLVAAIAGGALYYLGRPLGFDNVFRLVALSFFGLLAALTMRASFVAAYINYDYANEYLVYAHGSRGVRTVIDQIEDLSYRMHDGLGIKVAYDAPVAWPMTWYFRNFYNQAYYGSQPTREALDAPVVIAGPENYSRVEALLGNRYYRFEYIRMVWPMQDYFNLTWDRISNALGDPQMRQALWNIWYDRDYTLYGELTNQNFELSRWPVSDRMRMYVRRDVAAQIWQYGVGPTALDPGETLEDPHEEGRQVLNAVQVWGGEGSGTGQFVSPRGVAVAPDGSVYVADAGNHRIQKFDADGNFVLAWGSFGAVDGNTGDPGRFNEPWSVGVGPDGSVYVADTWNHRVQKFDANGQFIRMWGFFGQSNAFDALWGPRAIAVDSQGNVYVSDTGNKRIVVYDENGNGLGIIGSGGFDAGQLDEPVGVAVATDGTVFVADTWNTRMQAFEPVAAGQAHVYARQWPIAGWYGTSLENKPYVALDGQHRVYVTDPEGYRVLVFNAEGRFITTWGDFGSGPSAFGRVSGIGVGPDGSVYVSDVGNHRLMKFAPLP